MPAEGPIGPAMDPRDRVRTVGGPDLPQSWFVGPREAPDQYELLSPGLAGGEGVTWRARYRGGLSSPLPLAVKVLHRPVNAGPDWPTSEDRSRWRDQTALLRHLRLEHVVRVNEISAGPPPHRLGEVTEDAGESVIIEMEWVEGLTLAQVVGARAVTRANLQERLGFIQDVCDGLSQLHSHTLTAGNPAVYRDVAPSNCMITSDRGLVLIDVSTMQLPGDGVDPSGRHTPAYSAPEVLRSPHRPREPSADVYAVGALTFFCLTGHAPPPAGGTDTETAIRQQLRRATNSLPVRFDLVEHVMATLGANPDRRPADLVEWAGRLRTLASRRSATLVTAQARAAVAILLGAAVLSGGWLVVDHHGGRSPDHRPPAPVVSGSLAPTAAASGSVLPAEVASTSAGAARGVIMFPAPGATIKDCSYFTGTAQLPAATTLILAKRNLANGDEVQYIQTVFGSDKPKRQWSWRGAQFFNDSSVGQDQRVTLIAVPLKAAQALESDDSPLGSQLAKNGQVLDSVDVVRGPGKDGTTHCNEKS